MEWTNRDTALTFQGAGALANAWGAYQTGKERNKIASEALQYQKDLQEAADNRLKSAQLNLDKAWEDSSLNKKKKKKKDDTLDAEISYDADVTLA